LHQFQLKKKISSDAKTQTYIAIDSKLGRNVILVLLRNNLTEKENREFLLQARSLGILSHPGILPVYDMGLIGESFFYCFRPPPDDNLTKKLIKNKQKSWIFKKSRSFRLQVLENLAGTVAYAHERGVSVGKIDFNSIVIGNHGEIIISDWTKSRWVKSISEQDRNSTFKRWIQEDLQQLAKLGMHLYLLNNATNDLSLSRWSQASSNLPTDLLIALDRAYLGRPNEYKSVKEFQKDIDNHVKGKASNNFKGDFLTTITGTYRQHSKVASYLIALCLVCFAILFYMTIKTSGVSNENISKEITKTRLISSLENLNDELKSIKNKNDEFQLDKKNLTDELNWNNEQLKKKNADKKRNHEDFVLLKNSVATLQANLHSIEKEITKEDELLKVDIETKLKKIQQSINHKSQQVKTLAKHKNYRLNSYFSDKSKLENYRSNLPKYIKNKGWFSDYLIKANKGQTKTNKKNKEVLTYTPEKITINSLGNLAAWVESNKIYIYDFNASSKLQKFSTKNDNLVGLKFSNDNNILHAINEDYIFIYKYIPEESQLNLVLKIENEKYSQLIAYTPELSLGFLEGQILYYIEFTKPEENTEGAWEQRTFSRRLPEGSRLIAAPSGKHMLMHDNETFLLPQMRPIQYEGPKLHSIRSSDYLYSISGNTLTTYKPEVNIPFDKKITPLQSISLDAELNSITLNSENNACIINFVDGTNKLWSFNEFKGLEEISFIGKPILFYKGKILLQDNKNLYTHNLGTDPQDIHEYLEIFKEKTDAINEIVLDDDSIINQTHLRNEHDLLDIELPEEDNPIGFILNGPHRIELWDLKEKIRLDVIGISKRKMNRIYYSKEHKKIFAIGDDKMMEYWE